MHCAWGTCTSDSRKDEEGVTFLPFPKPKNNFKQAKRWTFLCGRGKDFTVLNITQNTYICSKHFKNDQVLSVKQNPSLEPFNALKENEMCRPVRPLPRCRVARVASVAAQFSPHKKFKWAKSGKIYSRSTTSRVSRNVMLDYSAEPGNLFSQL
jgi:hypothetical protein